MNLKGHRKANLVISKFLLKIGTLIIFITILFFVSANIHAENDAFLKISVLSNLNSMPIAGAKIKIDTTSNYYFRRIIGQRTIYADSQGNATYARIRIVDLKQGASKKSQNYPKIQFNITASAPGFNLSWHQVTMSYRNPRPIATLYLAPVRPGRHSTKNNKDVTTKPFENTSYCPDSNNCHQRGEKVTCKQVGGGWVCETKRNSAQANKLFQAKGMACGCVGASTWEVERHQFSKPTHNQTIQSLPRRSTSQPPKLDNLDDIRF